MGKKNSGSPLLIGIAVVIWILASIPKEVWVGLVILALAVLVIRYFFMTPSSTGVSSLSHDSTPQAGQRSTRASTPRFSVTGGSTDDLVTITINDGSADREYSIPTTRSGPLENATWVPPGQTATVAGIGLAGGMLYISTATRRGFQDNDPALIDPTLADGEFSSHEMLHLTRQIDSWAHLSEAHRKRLKAHLRLSMDQPLPLSSLKKKMEPLQIEAKRSIGRFLAHLTQADGKVTPEEVKFLERVYVTLSLDKQLVYSDLHMVSDANGKGISPAVSGESKPSTGFTLNAERIAQLQKETEEVSALLAGVFVEELNNEPEPMEVTTDESLDASTGILGLNAEHSAFVRRLVSQYSWSKSDLNDVAADMELMLDGTLEHINEMMLDMFETPLTEGDDPIEINRELVEQLPL